MTSRRWLALCALLAIVPAPARAGSVELVGVGWSFDDSPVYRIDPYDGAATTIGLSGFKGLNSLAVDRSGVLYSVSSQPGSDSGTLITIDPATGKGTAVAPIAADIRALAFSPGGVLYGIENGGGPSGTENPDLLLRIDPKTGHFTTVGSTGLALQSLEFAPDGTLYSDDLGLGGHLGGIGLVTIDPNTGVATDVSPADNGVTVGIQSLPFRPDGVLLGVGGGLNELSPNLYSIDRTTGALTYLGGSGFTDMRGIEFVGVPEPSAFVLLGLGALVVLHYRRLYRSPTARPSRSRWTWDVAKPCS